MKTHVLKEWKILKNQFLKITLPHIFLSRFLLELLGQSISLIFFLLFPLIYLFAFLSGRFPELYLQSFQWIFNFFFPFLIFRNSILFIDHSFFLSNILFLLYGSSSSSPKISIIGAVCCFVVVEVFFPFLSLLFYTMSFFFSSVSFDLYFSYQRL